MDGDYKMLSPEELLTNDIDQLRALVMERREEERANPRGQAEKKGRAGRGREQAREADNKVELGRNPCAAACMRVAWLPTAWSLRML